MDFTILLWIIATMIFATIACMIGKKVGLSFLIAIFSVSLILANIMATKLLYLGPILVSASIVIYSMTFLISDTISEFFGKKNARKAIYAGLFSLVFYVVFVQISLLATPAGIWDNQGSFEDVFSMSIRIALASVLAFLFAQSHDVWAYHFWKKQTKGRFLWLRNNFSTIISQIIDTIIFVGIGFYGVFPILPLIIGGIVSKGIIALVDTPLLYLIRYYWIKDKKRINEN